MNTEPTTTLSDQQGRRLLELARRAIERELTGATRQLQRQDGAEPWLQEAGAVFVTLHQAGPSGAGALRGCIGTLEATRPLRDDVESNAVSAALRDPRFPALTLAELPSVEIEVSVLSPQQTIPFASEAEAHAVLRPGVDGVVLEWRHHRATFLPQMWELLRRPESFIGELKRKAGLAADFWHSEIRLARYTVSYWSES